MVHFIVRYIVGAETCGSLHSSIYSRNRNLWSTSPRKMGAADTRESLYTVSSNIAHRNMCGILQELWASRRQRQYYVNLLQYVP